MLKVEGQLNVAFKQCVICFLHNLNLHDIEIILSDTREAFYFLHHFIKNLVLPYYIAFLTLNISQLPVKRDLIGLESFHILYINTACVNYSVC
jgi:hypothetical protein